MNVMPRYNIDEHNIKHDSMDDDTHGHQGEGCLPMSWRKMETGFNATDLAQLCPVKQQDEVPTMGFGPKCCPLTSAGMRGVTKRSFIRACRRASKDGYAWYQEQHVPFAAFPKPMQDKQLEKNSIETVPKQKPCRTEATRISPLNRLNVLHTNVGGMASHRFEEIQCWALQHEIDVIVLSETHGSFSSEWCNHKWNCIHSGTDQDCSDGIMILSRPHICPAEHIGLTEHIPGRLLHVRFHFTARSFDLICCYQYVDNRNTVQKQRRQTFWNKLQSCLTTIPNRNSLLLTGDFNCSLLQDGHHVGTSDFRWLNCRHRGRQHSDADQLHALLHRYDLTVLNSWNAQAPPTYCNGIQASRIDYFITRHADSDGFSKQIVYHPQADFLPAHGAMHIPMVCTVRKIPFAFTKTARQQTCTYRQRLQCRAAWRLNHEQWTKMMQQAHQQLDAFCTQEYPPEQFITKLHQTLMSTFHDFFPKHVPHSNDAHNTDLIESKWYHRRLMLAPTTPTLGNLYRTWFHYIKFQTLKRKHLQHIKYLKQQHLCDLIREVDQAALNHDSFKMFSIINRYTPKQPRKKIRLRSETGEPASTAEVQTLTQEFIRTKWAGPDQIYLTHIPFAGIPFDVAELQAEIARTPAVKSVAPPFLPGIVWKQMSHDIASLVYRQLEKWWTSEQIFVPAQWRHAWVTFLPKPNKPPCTLDNLRAIALMEPLGKNVLGIITRQLKDSLHATIVHWPQFAYVEHRSAHDAIRRVSQHCVDTRTLLRNQQRNIHQRAAGGQAFQICGGIQLFLDIHRAFDAIQRQPMFDHLRSLNVNQDLVTILKSWHSDTAYITQHDHMFVETATKCGIRQGCRAAPILWTSFTDLIFEKLSTVVNPAWLQQSVTLFADDIHSGDTFCSAWELQQIILRFGLLLDVIEQHGLEISLNKSMILISFVGTNFRKIQARLIQRDAHGCFILVPRADGRQSRLPVQKSACYLGVQMSYTVPEKLTQQHRMKAARQAFFRLRRWLKTKHIQLKTRLHLWRSCIYSTLIYGLLANNITFSGLHQLYIFIMGTLRQVVGNHSYLTGMTHSQFLHHYGIDHPYAQLLQSVNQLQHTHRQRLNKLLPHDIVHRVDWSNLTHVATLIRAAWEALEPSMDMTMLPEGDEAQAPIHHCSFCQKQFDSLPNLRRHQTHAHGQQQLRTHTVTIASHAKHGLPICMHCHKSFSTWRRFTIHMERNCCQALGSATSSMRIPSTAAAKKALSSQDLTLLLSKPYGQSLVQAVQTGQWSALRAMTQAHAELRNHCILCGTYHGRPQELNLHLRTQHGPYVANVHAKAAQFGKSQASITPCFYCEKAFLRQHQCPFWTQIALLQVNLPDTGTANCPDVVLRCEICTRQFDSLQALHSHLFTNHRLEIHDWQPTRDLLASEPVCAHCFSCFADRPAVRQHITRGQCLEFNAAKPEEEMSVAQHWQQMIVTGDLGPLHNSPMLRLSMTLHCQLCGVRFERQQDLAHHLQFGHADRWTHAQTMTQLLMQVGSLTTRCICNPQTTSRGVTHVCPAYRQLSMLALRVDQELYLPWTFNSETIRSFLAGVQNHVTVDTIVQILADRKFTDLWMHPSVSHLLSNVCLICGGTFHPAVLSEHVKAMHSTRCSWIPMILPQLLPEFLTSMTNDFQCISCHMIFNLPPTEDLTPEQLQPRAQLVQIHAQHHCPVALQTALLLTHGLHTGKRGSSDERCGGLGSLQGDGPTPSEGQVCPRSGGRKRYKKAQAHPCPGNQEGDTRSDQTGEAHGQHAAETGCRAPIDEKARLLRLLSANRDPGPSASTVATSQRMACSDETEEPNDNGGEPVCAIEISPVSRHGSTDGGSGEEACTNRSTRSALADSPEPWRGDQGRELPLSTLVPDTEDTDSHQEGAHLNATHAEVHGTDAIHFTGSNCYPEISRPAAGREQHDSAMDPPNRDASRRGPDTAGNPARLHSLGPDWSHHESTHTGGQQTESGAPTTSGQGQGEAVHPPGEIQRQGQASDSITDAAWRQSLRHRLETMQLINLENWCYANTAMITLLWALLTCVAIPVAEWGPLSQYIVHFLQFQTTTPVHLPDIWWFKEILHTWPGDGVQCDPVEFLTHLVRGFAIPGLNWSWERRVQLGSEISIRDQGGTHTPITLYIDPELSHSGWIRLDTLINSWHSYMGMQTALTHDAPLLCFHIDRHVWTGDGQPTKSDLSIGMHGVFAVPCYTDNGIGVIWNDYRVIAVITHLGTDQAGHCRAALRVQPEPDCAQGPFMQLLTDDNVAPSRCWSEPDWFLKNVMCVWMCKLSDIDEHVCAMPTSLPTDSAHEPRAPSMTQLLRQFAAMPQP